MTLYARVEYGNVIETRAELPRSTETISNFYLLPESQRRMNGWYTVTEDTRTCPEFYTEAVSYSMVAGDVVQTKTFTAIPLNEAKAALLQRVKSKASKEILDTVPQFKQINAALGIYSPEVTASIKDIITQHKTWADEMETLISQASSVDDLSQIQVE